MPAQSGWIKREVFAKGGRAGAQPAMSATEIKPIMPPKCPHGRRHYVCKDCGGGGLCEHGRQRSQCKECGGGGLCEHGRRRSLCKECGGGSICEHGRRRSQCKDCGGASICEHGRRRCYCKECGGASICEHGRRRNECKECGGSRQDAVILEATVVEVDEEAEPDEWIPTVQSYIVVAAAGPRGRKRKR